MPILLRTRSIFLCDCCILLGWGIVYCCVPRWSRGTHYLLRIAEGFFMVWRVVEAVKEHAAYNWESLCDCCVLVR